MYQKDSLFLGLTHNGVSLLIYTHVHNLSMYCNYNCLTQAIQSYIPFITNLEEICVEHVDHINSVPFLQPNESLEPFKAKVLMYQKVNPSAPMLLS
jgi:hypothetical protein